MFDKVLKSSVALSVIALSPAAISAAQETSQALEMGPIPIDCIANKYFKQKATVFIRHASKNLINKKLRMYGEGKKFKVRLYRCKTSVLKAGPDNEFETIDASYELTWKKKKFMGGKEYFLDLDVTIETDGSTASFNLINASHNLNRDFIRAFPLEIQYFNAYE